MAGETLNIGSKTRRLIAPEFLISRPMMVRECPVMYVIRYVLWQGTIDKTDEP